MWSVHITYVAGVQSLLEARLCLSTEPCRASGHTVILKIGLTPEDMTIVLLPHCQELSMEIILSQPQQNGA